MRRFDIPALILDFKDDYSEAVYAETEGLSVYDPSDQSLPFNPLAPAVDPRSGRVNPTYHVHQLTDILNVSIASAISRRTGCARQLKPFMRRLVCP